MKRERGLGEGTCIEAAWRDAMQKSEVALRANESSPKPNKPSCMHAAKNCRRADDGWMIGRVHWKEPLPIFLHCESKTRIMHDDG